MATATQRAHGRAVMRWLVDNEPLVHYKQARPMTTQHLTEQQLATRFHGGKAITSDCSETVTLICRLAGLADPNGLGYNGQGYTGTLLGHLPHYTKPSAAMAMALVVFGPGTGHHVCMVYDRGEDPMLFSHGKESDPRFVRLSEETRVQPGPVRFLSVAAL